MSSRREHTLPISIQAFRAALLAANPKFEWPEWAMPDAQVWVVTRGGEYVPCTDCSGGVVRLPSGRTTKCNCNKGDLWVSKYMVENLCLLVSVEIVEGCENSYVLVSFSSPYTSIMQDNMFQDEATAKAEADRRNQQGGAE